MRSPASSSLVVFAATTWFALRAAQVQRRLLRLALALIPLMVLVAIILVIFGDDETATVTARLVIILLVVVAPVAILRRLVQHPVISANTFYGAVCVYLLIAMFFATTFGLIAVVSGEPFFAQLQSSPDPATQIDYLYFSFVTLTTVGYGDLTAAADLGRMTGHLRGHPRPAVPGHRRGHRRPEPRQRAPRQTEHGAPRSIRGRRAGRRSGCRSCRHGLGRRTRGPGGLTQRRGRRRSVPSRRSVRPQRVPRWAPRPT